MLGATGYVGARLVGRLLMDGYAVRATSRSLEKLRIRPWSENPKVELVAADVLDRESLANAISNCDTIYYLVHSMASDSSGFAETDRIAAGNLQQVASEAGVRRIIYLGGLGDDDPSLSEHLKSRAEVAEILRGGDVSVTVIRAAMIIGSGSASFEILRYLVDRLPIMITPRWVHTECQPVAISDVLKYLVGCLGKSETEDETYDIGGPYVTTYKELMTIYAREAGLRKRLVIPVPVLTPRLSSYWIHLVTPVPSYFGKPLAEGLSNRVVCKDDRLAKSLGIPPKPYDEAFRSALSETANVVAIGTNKTRKSRLPEWSMIGDSNWTGGSVYSDCRETLVEASPERVWSVIERIGGENGWYFADFLWDLRGMMDKIIGGPGMRRGKSRSKGLHIGDKVDFWRVLDCEDGRSLTLLAEMKVPGIAVLGFRVEPDGDRTRLTQTAWFSARGLLGVLYWHAVSPLHGYVFSGMLREIAKAASGNESATVNRITRKGTPGKFLRFTE